MVNKIVLVFLLALVVNAIAIPVTELAELQAKQSSKTCAAWVGHSHCTANHKQAPVSSLELELETEVETILKAELDDEQKVDKLPGTCKVFRRVCLYRGSVVALHENKTVASDKFSAKLPPKFHPANVERLKWLREQAIQFNMPGEFDGAKGVQQTVHPVSTRMVSESEHILKSAPLLRDVVPVLLFSTWPFNIGESFNNVLHPWARFLVANPSIAKHLAMVVPTPFNLELPHFWQVLAPLLSKATGKAVGSFEDAGECETGSCAQPLCFERVVGCREYTGGGNWGKADKKGNWVAALDQIAKHFCHGEAADHSSGRAKGVLKVGFALRHSDTYRKIKNRDAVLEQCNGATVNGMKLECSNIVLTDLTKDICPVRKLDVLVTMTGAQVANANFMRPGSSVVEIRPHLWYNDGSTPGEVKNLKDWFNFYNRQLWGHNSTFYWWLGVTQDATSLQPGLVMTRDADVVLDWKELECVLGSIVSVKGDQAQYEKRRKFGNIASDCGVSSKVTPADRVDGTSGSDDERPPLTNVSNP